MAGKGKEKKKKAKAQQKQEPDLTLRDVLKLFVKMPPSTGVDSLRLRFHWALLVLPFIAFAFSYFGKFLVNTTVRWSTKQYGGFAFLINEKFKESKVDIAFVIAIEIFVLGFCLYQSDLNIGATLILSLFALINNQMFSLLVIPSFSLVFLTSIVSISLFNFAIHYNIGSLMWIALSVSGGCVAGIAHAARPEAISLIFIEFFLFLCCFVRRMLSFGEASMDQLMKTLGMLSQIFVVATPFFFISGILNQLAPSSPSLSMSESVMFRRAFMDDWAAFPLFLFAIFMTSKMEVTFNFMAVSLCILLGAIACVVLPIESVDEPVAGKLFLFKVLMLLFTSLVFGSSHKQSMQTVLSLILSLLNIATYDYEIIRKALSTNDEL